MRSLAAAGTMETLVNSYISQALSGAEGYAIVDEGFGGFDEIARDASGMAKSKVELAHAIARRVLGARWWYTLVHSDDPALPVRVEILGGF